MSTNAIVIEWRLGQTREFADFQEADAALLERRLPAVVTIDGAELRVSEFDLADPEFSILDVPYFREVES